jgi:hypothetical protein
MKRTADDGVGDHPGGENGSKVRDLLEVKGGT